MPTRPESDQDSIPELVEDTSLQVLYPSVQSPSDEEADREVAAICRVPIYYQQRSLITRRCHYYMYNVLDSIEKANRVKCRHAYSPHVRGLTTEY